MFMLSEIKKIKDQKVPSPQQIIVYENNTPVPVATTKPTEKDQKIIATPIPEKRITYLNLNGSFSTQSTDWVDIKTTDVLIDLDNEYGTNAYVDWDSTVGVGSSGSKVFVRLYDATHNIAVNGSELESGSVTIARVASGRLYLWRGQNTYRVQIKSLNGISATFNGGRIKIVY